MLSSWSLSGPPEVALKEVRLTALGERQEPFDEVFVELCPFKSEQGRKRGFCKIKRNWQRLSQAGDAGLF